MKRILIPNRSDRYFLFGRPQNKMKTHLQCTLSLIFLLFLVFDEQSVCAQAENTPLSMKALFSSEKARPGDVVTLTLLYKLPKGAKFPDKPFINGLEEFTVISTEIRPNEATVKLIVDTLHTLEIPKLTLSFIDENNKKQEITGDPIQLQVISAPEASFKNLDIRTIKDIMPVNWILWKRWLPYLFIASGVFAAFGVWWFLRTRKKKLDISSFSEPPDKIALKALEDLESSGLFEKGEIKGYYFSLSEIVRRYMEEIRSFPAYELTTEEIAAHVHTDEDRKIVRILRYADLVKFADDRPTVAQKDEHRFQTRQYIEKTSMEREEDLPKF